MVYDYKCNSCGIIFEYDDKKSETPICIECGAENTDCRKVYGSVNLNTIFSGSYNETKNKSRGKK